MNPSTNPDMMLRLAAMRSSDDRARASRRRRVLDRPEPEADRPPSAWPARPRLLRLVRNS